MEQGIFMKYSGIAWRILWLALAVGIFLGAYHVGASLQLSIEQAKNIQQELGQRNKSINQISIFENNVIPSLEMFIPGLGTVVGIYSAYSTGQAFSAFAAINPILRTIFPLSVFVSPFAILETLAYGLAMSRSGMLVHYLVTKRKSLRQSYKKILIPTAIDVGVVILILFVGSIVEWQILLERRHQLASH
jgi:hypothetical protein